MTDQCEPPSRRQVLHGAALVGGTAVAAATMAACAASNGRASLQSEIADAAPAAGTAIGEATSVPVGGGKIFGDVKVVVTQPSQGDFLGFSAICTHQGCLVNTVTEGQIHCPCHGSEFSITDGSVTRGPARLPLPAQKVIDDSGTLRAG